MTVPSIVPDDWSKEKIAAIHAWRDAYNIPLAHWREPHPTLPMSIYEAFEIYWAAQRLTRNSK